MRYPFLLLLAALFWGSLPPLRAAAFTDADWVALNPTYPGVNGTIFAMASDGNGNVYVGGDFTIAGGVPANRIAKWNGTTWSALGSGSDGDVRAMAVIGTDVYAGGRFTVAGRAAPTVLAKWNGTSWSALGTGIPADQSGDVRALAVVGGKLYAGGLFGRINDVAGTSGIAQWNGATWLKLGTGSLMNGGVFALSGVGTDLYIGGTFTTAGGISANRIVRWNGSAWSTVAGGLSQSVYAMTTQGNQLYAGGAAKSYDTTTVSNWNGTAWSALGPGVGRSVSALAMRGGTLFAGGGFTEGGSNIPYLAQWNGGTWTPVGAGISGAVITLTAAGNDLYAGGIFEAAGNSPAIHVAKWDGTRWSPLGSGTSSTIFTMAAGNGKLYVAGPFARAGGKISPYLAMASIGQSPRELFDAAAAAAGLSGAEAAPLAMPSADGSPLLVKYAFNMALAARDATILIPATGTTGLPSVTCRRDPATGGYFCRVEFLRRTGSGLNYLPQKTSNPAAPAWNPLTSAPVTTSISPLWERVVHEEPFAPASAPAGFIRVLVQLP